MEAGLGHDLTHSVRHLALRSRLEGVMTGRTNWAGNYTFRASRVLEPGTVGELQELVARARCLRVLGSSHSFNDIADTAGDQVSLAALDPAISIDSAARTVSVSGGIRYGQLAAVLDRQGWALHNLASLPHISIAGTIATGTHGSGDTNGNLSTAVTALDLVTSSGESITLNRHAPEFAGAVVGLGTLGVVSRVELSIEPGYRVRQTVFESLPWRVVEDHFDAITSAGYSVSLFTDWASAGVQQVWVKDRVGPANDDPGRDPRANFFGAAPATVRRHPLPGIEPINCTDQLGVAGPWHERLPHFRAAFTPSNGDEIQSEYLLPREQAVAAMTAIRRLSGRVSPLLQVGEIRTVRSDDLWLSAAYGRDTVGFHFTWIRDQPMVAAVIPLIEETLAPFSPRPHWGKVFRSSASEIAAVYPCLPEFRALAGRLDPKGVFQNAFTRRYLFPD